MFENSFIQYGVIGFAGLLKGGDGSIQNASASLVQNIKKKK